MAAKLKRDALGIVEALCMAVAGSAPAFSITASTGVLAAAAGLAAPAVLWIAFIPMTGIGFAFFYLNRWRSDAGAAYAWAGRAVSPLLGFFAGWALLSLSTIFMVAAALPAALATLDLFAPSQLHNVVLATGVGVVWFLGVLGLVTCGITAAAKVQTLMTILEVGALVLISGFAVLKAQSEPAAVFSWSWFSPFAFGSFQTFSAGMLVGVFYYLGWDVSANLSEETKNAGSIPGLGGIVGIFVIFILFIFFQTAVQMALTRDEIEANSGNLLPAAGRIVLPWFGSTIAVIAVLVSVIGTLETQLLQCTRLLYSMARDGVTGKLMGRLHPRFQTPWLAGFAVAAISLLLFAVSATVPTISQLMSELISAIGIQVTFYYAAAAFTCFWYYRKVLLSDWRVLIFAGIVPLLSGVFMAAVGVFELPQLGLRVSIISVGTIAIGILPLWYYRRRYRSAFYTGGLECASARSISQPD